MSEFLTDARRVANGIIAGIGDWQNRLEQNKQSFAQEWVARAEFLARYPEPCRLSNL